MDCSLPGSSIHEIFQARILEWVAISFSRGSSQPRNWTWVSCIVGRQFTIWATREARRTCILFCPWEHMSYHSADSNAINLFHEYSRGLGTGVWLAGDSFSQVAALLSPPCVLPWALANTRQDVPAAETRRAVQVRVQPSPPDSCLFCGGMDLKTTRIRSFHCRNNWFGGFVFCCFFKEEKSLNFSSCL